MSEPLLLEDDETEKKKSPLFALIPIIAMALIALGAGWAVSQFVILPNVEAKVEASTMLKAQQQAMDEEIEGRVDTDASGQKLSVVQVEPIVTNIADPSSVWIRAEFSILVRDKAPDAMIAQFQNDVITYLKTQRLQNLQGSSSFQHLLEDVTSIARLKNPDLVDRVLVRSFIIE